MRFADEGNTMERIQGRDLQRLRALAQKQLEYAHSPANEIILKKWEALGSGRRETPTVRLLYSNFWDEVIGSRLECTGAQARKLEDALLSTLVGRELFDDDTPIAPTFDVQWNISVRPFGFEQKITYIPT